jgi:hypothetical protein
VRFLLAFAGVVALAGCSFVGVHYPAARPASGVRCLTVLPIADAVGAAAALSAGGYRYAVETRTSPFPLSMVVVGAWATASAIYGFTEDARCRSALAEPAP